MDARLPTGTSLHRDGADLTITVTLNGVGEVFDPDEPHSSTLVEAYGFTLLVDCGHSVRVLWRRHMHPDQIDAIYLIHHHADGVLGLVPRLDRFGFDGRRRRLAIHTTPEHALAVASSSRYSPGAMASGASRFSSSSGVDFSSTGRTWRRSVQGPNPE